MPKQAIPASTTRPRPRRRKPILRVKTGCFTCRNRKKKCDETRPVCAGCLRNKVACRWPDSHPHSPPSTEHGSGEKALDLRPSAPSPDGHGRRTPETLTSPADLDFDVGIGETLEETITVDIGPSSNVLEHETSPPESSPVATTQAPAASEQFDQVINCLQDAAQETVSIDADGVVEGVGDAVSDALIRLSWGHFDQDPLSLGHASVPPAPSIMPGLDAQSFELMSHYLARTAISMGNGSTTANPFVVQLIPLSFANPVVLELMLSQSASHRAVLEGAGWADAVAQNYYTKSIRLFRNAVADYLAGTEASPLWVTIGALIMCFTETAKGDTNGVIFDHLQAVGPLVKDLVSRHRHLLPDGLRPFVIEYYVYTAIISMISMDPSASTGHLLAPELEYEAHSLVESGYVGQLCGSWLPLLLLIPRIFDFGRRRVAVRAQPPFPTADDFLNFSNLQAEITSFTPSPLVESEVATCGYIFQQAVHLYLLTAFGVGDAGQVTQQLRVENALVNAFLYLEQLPSSARINTSMCWALAVIGSCTADDERRDVLRQRLNTMFVTIGLGNISSTLSLLEHIWARPREEQSPWIICRIMYEYDMWISLA
ncbi:Zn(2)-C6 fungal-type domain-containing protein [Fusarium keratoplasticum]|uniref:Zn(2)-C6 fungal-type domain-containing protein n=1 Tax=Fusarium keratoplasticum TaxID=1328300 RepID=A0ACC0R7N5_9HYPO|nr:Zn(2)-C6 fungal-type domain-containing protein [Fusarium keratoplasticum]KAI8675572.1 Zn(2)-C6 fungal-type domain-containing protein [Fusarium keratoplasticum]